MNPRIEIVRIHVDIAEDYIGRATTNNPSRNVANEARIAAVHVELAKLHIQLMAFDEPKVIA